MKKLHILSIFILFLIGSILFLGCEKQETETFAEDNLSSSFKASGGYALYFDGDGDYVMVPDDASLDLTDAFTIAAWINIESYVEWASIATKGGEPDNENNYTIHQSGSAGGTNDGHLRFTADVPALPLFLESNTLIPVNEWHFVAVTWDGEMLKFYFNGESDGGGALEGPLATNDVALHIGADFPGGDEFWHGMIDEVRIWNEALKQTHIQAAMNGHSTPLARALVGYWRFDEGEGNVAKDRSKYKNHGVLVGGAAWVSPGAPFN